ncbi:MAG: hypothetical protein KAT28_04400 [Candidatus Aenigmarchaeota archaeon]|nr:hypothetical protein [Candidatus Aenigmarchaeota archaeon]
MRTNFLLIGLITILLISNINFASETYPSIYDNLIVEKNISESLVAGSTNQIKISFENLVPVRNTLIVMVNISSIIPIGLNDFQIKGKLNSTIINTSYSEIKKFSCSQLSANPGIFYCLNLTEIEVENCYEQENITICNVTGNKTRFVLPFSENKLILNVTPNIALKPGDYSFKVGLFSGIRIENILKESKTINLTENISNSTEFLNGLLELNLTSEENKTISLNLTFYNLSLGNLNLPGISIPILFDLSANDTENLSNIEIKINYSKIGLPSGFNESSIELYYYNKTTYTWEKIENYSVNKTGNYILVRLLHLSLYGVFGEKIIIPSIYAAGGGHGTELRKAYMAITPTGATMKQNTTRDFEIEIRNIGNRDIENFEVTAEDSEVENWINIIPSKEKLGIGEIKFWIMTISIPEDAELGTKYFAINATGDELSLSINFTLTVAKKPEIFIKEEEPEIPEDIIGLVPSDLMIIINNGNETTNSKNITLTLSATNATECRLNNDGIEWSNWEDYTITREWELSPAPGTKTVYYQCTNEFGNSIITYETIEFIVPRTAVPTGFAILTNPTILISIITGILGILLFLLYRRKK